MIDLHTHMLPGIDDGPSDLAGSLAMARAAVAAGTQIAAATPHIGPHHGVVTEELASRVAELQRELDDARIPLQVVPGGELAPTHAADASVAELQRITLGGGRCLLLECPFTSGSGLMPVLLEQLRGRGFRVLLAHPERSPEFLRDPRGLAMLVDAGVCIQITAASLLGGFGQTPQRYALGLLDAGLVHAVASDAHDAERRPPEVLGIVEPVVRECRLPPATTRFVTVDAPRALLDDAPLPPAPSRESRSWRRRRSRR
jgi:protein-tyrosine phosphatase